MTVNELKAKSFEIIKRDFAKRLQNAYDYTIKQSVVNNFNYEVRMEYGKYDFINIDIDNISLFGTDRAFRKTDESEATNLRIHVRLEDAITNLEFTKDEFDEDKIIEEVADAAIRALVEEME